MTQRFARSRFVGTTVQGVVSLILVLAIMVASSPFEPTAHAGGEAFVDAGLDCGNQTVDDGEACDEGLDNGDEDGVWCGTNCSTTPCGSPVSRIEGDPGVADALFVLRAAVSLVTCDLRICDVNNKGGVTVADALQILRLAVGQEIALTCPAPVPDVTCVNKTFETVTEVFEALAGDYEVFLDDGFGSIDDVYTSGTLAMRILPNFIGKKFVTTSVNGSTSYVAAFYDDGRAGESWEDLENEVNVFFVTEAGTSKILQCDKLSGQLTFVVQAGNSAEFARLKTPLP